MNFILTDYKIIFIPICIVKTQCIASLRLQKTNTITTKTFNNNFCRDAMHRVSTFINYENDKNNKK